MKKFFIAAVTFGVFVAIIFGIAGSMQPSDFSIQVNGSKGTKFRGSMMVMVNGSSKSESISGKIPETFTARGNIVSVSLQKDSPYGVLEVDIQKDGVSKSKGTTTDAYGVVAVSSN